MTERGARQVAEMGRKRFVVVDYGMGNLRSVLNAFSALRANAVVSHQKEEIEGADAYILPGVGAFGEAMRALHALNLINVLSEQVLRRRKPLLGICLGMQLIAQDAEEMGCHDGLGWIPGHVKRLEPGADFRVLHIGWNDVAIAKKDPMFLNLQEDRNFYFVHSYHVVCDDASVAATCQYGATAIVAALQNGNIFATQFHPEKSQANGLRLLRNYIEFVERYVPYEGRNA